MLERQTDLRAELGDGPAFDYDILFDDFSHAEIAQGLGGLGNRGTGRVLPGLAAGADQLNHVIYAAHLSLLKEAEHGGTGQTAGAGDVTRVLRFPQSQCRHTLWKGQWLLIALLIAGAVALGVAWFVERSKRGNPVANIRMVDAAGLAVAAGLVSVGGGIYWQARGFFVAHAHTASAIAMFIIVGVVVVLNSQRTGVEDKPRCQLYYALAGGVMASGQLVVPAHFVWARRKP